MAVNDALKGIEAKNVAVLYPTNFQITEAVKLLLMAMPDLQLTKGENSVTLTAPAAPDAEQAIEAVKKASLYLYGISEMVSRLVVDGSGWPALVIDMFVWTDRQ